MIIIRDQYCVFLIYIINDFESLLITFQYFVIDIINIIRYRTYEKSVFKTS